VGISESSTPLREACGYEKQVFNFIKKGGEKMSKKKGGKAKGNESRSRVKGCLFSGRCREIKKIIGKPRRNPNAERVRRKRKQWEQKRLEGRSAGMIPNVNRRVPQQGKVTKGFPPRGNVIKIK